MSLKFECVDVLDQDYTQEAVMAVPSPAPGTPQTPTKAVLAALVGFVGTFIVSLSTALAGKGDESIGGREWMIIILGALAVTIVSGGFVYQIPNKAT